MITFSQFLTESRSAPLYHSTTMSAANRILDDNTMYGTMQFAGQTDGKKVIFTTRSLKQAKHFMRFDAAHQSVAIIVFDQEKLGQRYKIKPIKNWAVSREEGKADDWIGKKDKRNFTLHKPMYMNHAIGMNEFEEIIITDKITDISKYITSILVNRDPKEYSELGKDLRVKFI